MAIAAEMSNNPCHSGLGVKLVLALGTSHQVDAQLRAEGQEPQYVGGYRVRHSLDQIVIPCQMSH